ncbi:MAG: aminotransferase class I/II-fold pyridoxal phosphate-dependent enzyme [Verrucomicrobiae bacterium]|nr:aminotransferase class I/II-fold pyridoxal phosphate-dependent enzyme [Verrucomicrobiae bacterium]
MQEPRALRLVAPTWVEEGGRRLSYFGGSDYLKMSWHARVRAAGAAAVETMGLSAGASRMTTGNLEVYKELEEALRAFLGIRERVVLTSSGYVAPWVAVQALAGSHDRVLLDARAHGCLVDAARWTGLPIGRFPHRDADGLRGALAEGAGARVLVMTDGLFSQSGEVAPLGAYLEVLPRGATLLVDDAHGVGVLGRRGRGTIEWTGVPAGRVVLTGTLSKALGCYGGWVAGGAGFRRRVLERSALYTGNTPMPPVCAAAALESLWVLAEEGGVRRERLATNMDRMRGVVSGAGDGPGPMFSLAPTGGGGAELGRRLRAAGILPPRMRYPNGPAPEYFRFAISSEHSAGQMANLREVLDSFHRDRG